jgi:hypothetical protein
MVRDSSGGERSRQVPERGRHLELCVRANASGAGYEHLVGRLRELKREGVVDSFVVELWDPYIDVSSDDVPSAVKRARALLTEFDDWAGIHESSLEGWASDAPVSRGRMGQTATVRRTPAVLLAEYVDGKLEHVTPRSQDRLCVSMRLEQLATEAATKNRSREGRRRGVSRSRSGTRRTARERRSSERRNREPLV